MTKLLTIPKFAEATGLSYRLCLSLWKAADPSVPVGSRRRIEFSGVEPRLAPGGYLPDISVAGGQYVSL
jgi:hypothetical protein